MKKIIALFLISVVAYAGSLVRNPDTGEAVAISGKLFRKPYTWTPTEFGADLTTWYDASDTNTVTVAGGAVSQWDDKAGTNHLYQATGANQPTYGTNTLNGLYYMDFVPGGKWMSIAGNLGMDDGAAVYFIYRHNSVLKANFICIRNSLGGYDRFASDCRNRIFKTSTLNVENYGLPLGATTITGYKADGSSNIFDCRVNGNEYFSTNLVYTFSDNFTGLGGTGGAGANNDFYGYVAEVIFVDKWTTDAEDKKLEGYLAWKWGLEGNLPADHPYKLRKPYNFD